MIADVGMTGPLHSAIGQNFESRIPGMLSGIGLFSAKQEPLVD